MTREQALAHQEAARKAGVLIMPKFHVTYEVVTYESAEHGDCAEMGYVSPGGWHGPEPAELSLHEAVKLVSGLRSMEDCGRWFCDTDGDIDYQTGAEERRSLHPPANITAASYGRLRRLLCYR